MTPISTTLFPLKQNHSSGEMPSPGRSVHITLPCGRNEPRVLLWGLENAVLMAPSACDYSQGVVGTVGGDVLATGQAVQPRGHPRAWARGRRGTHSLHSGYGKEDGIGPPRGPESDVLSCLQRQGVLSNSGEGPVRWRCVADTEFPQGRGLARASGKSAFSCPSLPGGHRR